MHKTLTQQKLLVPSEYRSAGGLKTDFTTTELAATINV